MDDLTNEEIAELRRLHNEATPGPWAEDDQQLTCPDGLFAIVWPTNDDCACWRPQDLAMVVAARNALPRLLDEVERLRERVKLLERVREAAEAVAFIDNPLSGGGMGAELRLRAALHAAKDRNDKDDGC